MLQLLGTLPGAIAQGLVWGIMAIGVYITYKILDMADLTVDGSICTGAAVCTMMILAGINPYLALLGALISGIIAGTVTGAFHIVLGIPPILAGILTQLILWSLNLKIMGKANQAISARNFKLILSSMDLTNAIIILAVICAIIIAVLYWFFGTELGCSVRSTGCNEKMSRAQGINTNVTKLLGLALSNGIVALSGGILCQYQGYADINMGRGAIVIGLASVIIGEAIISKIGKNFALRLFGVILGGVIYYIVYQVVIFLGLDTDLLKMFSAIVVALFLGLPHLKATYFSKAKGGKTNA